MYILNIAHLLRQTQKQNFLENKFKYFESLY